MFLSELKRIIFTVGLLFLFTIEVFPQDHFQGKVTFQVTEEGQTNKISYLVKGNKFRIEPGQNEQMGMGVILFDADKNLMTVLMNEQKMYMQMPLDNSAGMMDDESTGDEYFVKTGESKNIMGYSCDQFKYTDGEESGFAWMTKELGPFMFMRDPEGASDSENKWQQEIMEEGYFPMLVEQESPSGKMEKVFEVIDLKAMNLDDTLFSIPPGFSKFDMPGMMDGNK